MQYCKTAGYGEEAGTGYGPQEGGELHYCY